MFGLLRCSRLSKRFATEYVLARRVNGKLEVAELDRTDRDFSFNPRMTAMVSLNGQDGLVRIGGVHKIVKEGVRGRITGIQRPKGQDWYGFMKADGIEKDLVFKLVN